MSGLWGALSGAGEGLSEVGRHWADEAKEKRISEYKQAHQLERDKQKTESQIALGDRRHEQNLERDAIANAAKTARDKEVRDFELAQANKKHSRQTARDKAQHARRLEADEKKAALAARNSGTVTLRSGGTIKDNHLIDLYEQQYPQDELGRRPDGAPSIRDFWNANTTQDHWLGGNTPPPADQVDPTDPAGVRGGLLTAGRGAPAKPVPPQNRTSKQVPEGRKRAVQRDTAGAPTPTDEVALIESANAALARGVPVSRIIEHAVASGMSREEATALLQKAKQVRSE